MSDYSSGPTEEEARQVIKKRYGSAEWRPEFHPLPDGEEMDVLKINAQGKSIGSVTIEKQRPGVFRILDHGYSRLKWETVKIP